jgi:hypothetical protein
MEGVGKRWSWRILVKGRKETAGKLSKHESFVKGQSECDRRESSKLAENLKNTRVIRGSADPDSPRPLAATSEQGPLYPREQRRNGF